MKDYPALQEYIREADALAEQVFAASSESRLAVRLATKVQALAEAAREESPGPRRAGGRRNPDGAFDVSHEDVDLIVNALSFYRSKVGSSSLRERILDLIKLLWPALKRGEVGGTGWTSFEEFAESSLDSQIDRSSKYRRTKRRS